MSSRTRPSRHATRGGPGSRRTRRDDDDNDDEIPKVYRDMLAEAEARETESSDGNRPKKRLKPSGYRATVAQAHVAEETTQDGVETRGNTAKNPQIVYNSPSESEDESDMEWEEVDIQQQPALSGPTGSVPTADDTPLQLTLGQQDDRKRRVIRRKPVTAAERKIRLDVHKTHLLCLLCHVQRRNLWCNDEEVQGFIKKMLPRQIISQLNPSVDKPQHTRSAMFLEGLNKAGDIFSRKFTVTKPGLRRPHWAPDSDSLRRKTAAIMSEAEVLLSRDDFQRQAKTMQGSRDFGAQLFCALLRSAAIEARLVCSLQPLPFSGTVRDIPVKPEPQTIVISSDDYESLTDGQSKSDNSPRPSRIRRLGQPGFKPTRVQTTSAARPTPIRESSYPVFWVEAFNEAFQKWIPIDPMVTRTLAKPHKLEPSAADPHNLLNYVVAFEEDASARDVTRRYTKAFNAKVRKNRVESTKDGEVWLERVLDFFQKPFLEDRDELEIAELTGKTAAEPIPRNVQDFKDHPIYALERHLRRNEVIFPKTIIGRVSLGKAGVTEPIYRRSAVQTLRSANKWYRLGRDIKIGEQALKRLPARNRTIHVDDEDTDMAEETTLYALFQTELYNPPPVVEGRIPKNAYGNLDVYVPTMVPPGGFHIRHPDAAHAARILGIDHADAVTGFDFKGRHGTAVFHGAVVASEYREAVEEVIKCLEEEKLHHELEQRSAEVLRAWKHFLLKLRIAERVRSYVVEGEADDEASVGLEAEDSEMGGGFLPESDVDADSPVPQPELSPNDMDENSPPLAEVQGLSGGGFLPEGPVDNTPVKEQYRSPRAARSKYSLIVVPDNADVREGDPRYRISHKPRALTGSCDAPITVESSVNDSASATAEPPITVDSSVNGSASASVEALSRAPSQLQSRAPSPEVISDDSDNDKGSLLSEDPEDEDAVPEWLMSD
ncbi:hypothetical protein BDW59DRAFT_144426 [Aspergillus cavernicola]|uniref:Rad4-domain-containing protein n=1 Tax=Aspergillus cavernicola TaxID=176166 RepID=A0ABR4IHJ7_9EURO